MRIKSSILLTKRMIIMIIRVSTLMLIVKLLRLDKTQFKMIMNSHSMVEVLLLEENQFNNHRYLTRARVYKLQFKSFYLLKLHQTNPELTQHLWGISWWTKVYRWLSPLNYRNHIESHLNHKLQRAHKDLTLQGVRFNPKPKIPQLEIYRNRSKSNKLHLQ
jgi:hypothetical protein